MSLVHNDTTGESATDTGVWPVFTGLHQFGCSDGLRCPPEGGTGFQQPSLISLLDVLRWAVMDHAFRHPRQSAGLRATAPRAWSCDIADQLVEVGVDVNGRATAGPGAQVEHQDVASL